MACSISRLLPNDGRPKRLSRETPLPVVPGGGAKDVLATGSGDGRAAIGAGALAADMLAGGESYTTLTGRWLRGGEYGGGGGGDAVQ